MCTLSHYRQLETAGNSVCLFGFDNKTISVNSCVVASIFSVKIHKISFVVPLTRNPFCNRLLWWKETGEKH